MKKYYKFGWVLVIALILSLFAGIAYYLESQVKSWMQEVVRNELIQDAETLSSLLTNFSPDFSPEFTPESLDPLIDRLNKNSNNRITIIDSSGNVLADSELTLNEVLSSENHKNSPEFLSASNTVPGESIRHSLTLKQDMLYVAVPFQAEGFSGFVRVSHSLADIDKYTHKLRTIQKTVGLIGLLILSIIITLSYGFIQRHNNSQKQVEQKTKSLLDIQKCRPLVYLWMNSLNMWL